MKKKIAKILVIIGICLAFLVSCSKTEEVEKEEKVKLDIPSNIVVKNIENDLKYYSIKDSLVQKISLEIPGEIHGFNKENSMLVYSTLNDDKTKTIINATDGIYNKEIEVDGAVNKLLLNENGTKILYKVTMNDGSVEYQWVDLNINKINVLEDKIIVSGDLIEFLDNNNAIFYGVDVEHKKSGLFNLNIETNEYKLIHQVSNAFVDYIKILDNERVLFVESTIEGNKKVYVLNNKENSLDLITEEVKSINQSYFKDNKLYFTGELMESRFSLYSLDLVNKEIKRLVFDFPKYVSENSNIIFMDNKLFFVGYDNDEYNTNIYSYELGAKSIRILEAEQGQCIILEESR